MKTIVLLWFALLIPNLVWADATLKYELEGPKSGKKQFEIAISGMMARIDEQGADDQSLLFEAGHLFPLYRLNHTQSRYETLTPKFKAYLRVEEDRQVNKDLFSYPPITLKPTRKQAVISGIKCRLVHEINDGEPVIEHCIASSARAGLTERVTRSLIRTHAILRKYQGTGWLGVGTTDEVYVSVRSRHLKNEATLTLTNISYKTLDPVYLQIPKNYTKVEANDK